MAYVQLSLLNIPAIVVHGNALSVEAWGTWFTPAHILGGWGAKLRVKRFREAMESLTRSPLTPTNPLPRRCRLDRLTLRLNPFST
jgi:hypothetical protein